MIRNESSLFSPRMFVARMIPTGPAQWTPMSGELCHRRCFAKDRAL
jgi:hypothetical protein